MFRETESERDRVQEIMRDEGKGENEKEREEREGMKERERAKEKNQRERDRKRERERESSRGRRFFLFFFPREGPKSTASEGGKRNFATGSGGCNVASASTTARSRICKDFQQKADVRRAQLNCARLCFGRGICPFSSMYTLLRVKISRVIKMHNCVKVCFPLTFPKASSYIGSGDEVAIHYRWP